MIFFATQFTAESLLMNLKKTYILQFLFNNLLLSMVVYMSISNVMLLIDNAAPYSSCYGPSSWYLVVNNFIFSYGTQILTVPHQ